MQMTADNKVRQPKQKRSIQMKEKILDAALQQIGEKGFFETSTNAIARQAGISHGSRYSYFKDNDAILLELLHRHHQRFSIVFESLDTEENRRLFEHDRRAWLRWLVCALVDLNTSTGAFAKELNALYYQKPEVAAVMDARRKTVQAAVLENMKEKNGGIKSDDLEAASVVVTDMVAALVDRIAFKHSAASRESILQTGVEIIYRGCMS